MSEQKSHGSQPDKDLAATERPVPSQAEGDRETVEQDLKDQDEKTAADAKSSPQPAKK